MYNWIWQKLIVYYFELIQTENQLSKFPASFTGADFSNLTNDLTIGQNTNNSKSPNSLAFI